MSITPIPKNPLEVVSLPPQPAWSQLTSTAGASDAIVQQGPPEGNHTGEAEDVAFITASNLARILGGTVTGAQLKRSQFNEFTPTAGESYSSYEPHALRLMLRNVALQPEVIAAYASRMLAPTNIPWEYLAPATFNVEPLALLRIGRPDMGTTRDIALADARRRLDSAKGLHSSRSPRDMVNDLSEIHGLNQLSTARAIGVTPTAVRKWRRGEPARPEFRDRLAQLTALLDLLRNEGQEEPAGWLEVPVSSESTLTPLDLFAARRPDLAILLGSAAEDPQTVLSSFDPAWRRNYPPDEDYDVVVAADGNRAVVPRGDVGL
jgi:transcriptional regulator with XRE-family HTH domain